MFLGRIARVDADGVREKKLETRESEDRASRRFGRIGYETLGRGLEGALQAEAAPKKGLEWELAFSIWRARNDKKRAGRCCAEEAKHAARTRVLGNADAGKGDLQDYGVPRVTLECYGANPRAVWVR